MDKLTPVWRDENVSIQNEARLVSTLVFSDVLYRAETWTIREADRRESMRSKFGAGDDFWVFHGQHANDFVLLEAGNPEPLESKATLAKL